MTLSMILIHEVLFVSYYKNILLSNEISVEKSDISLNMLDYKAVDVKINQKNIGVQD